MLKNYLKLNKDELLDLIFITSILGLLFAISCIRFAETTQSFISVYLSFFIFLFVLLFGRLIFMKYIAYRNNFVITFRMTYFDRYWFRNYDRLSYTAQAVKYVDVKNYKNTKEKSLEYDFKGIPMPIISLTLYILTLGSIVFPSLWSYKVKPIKENFMGKKSKYEKFNFFDVSDYRYSKVFFGGFLYYLLFAFFFKMILKDFGYSFYNWFTFAIFWIAFITILPILGTEGYVFYSKGRIGWMTTLIFLTIGIMTLLIFESFIYLTIVTMISIVFVAIIMLWRELMV